MSLNIIDNKCFQVKIPFLFFTVQTKSIPPSETTEMWAFRGDLKKVFQKV